MPCYRPRRARQSWALAGELPSFCAASALDGRRAQRRNDILSRQRGKSLGNFAPRRTILRFGRPGFEANIHTEPRRPFRRHVDFCQDITTPLATHIAAIIHTEWPLDTPAYMSLPLDQARLQHDIGTPLMLAFRRAGQPPCERWGYYVSSFSLRSPSTLTWPTRIAGLSQAFAAKPRAAASLA